jgi:spermidine synthase
MKKPLILSLSALGISSIITQIILMREFLNVFSGNELVFGIIFANWLLLTGIGSYLSKFIKKKQLNFFIISQIIISILPFFQIFLIRLSRNFIFTPGLLLGLNELVIFSFLILLPYCLLSGVLLTIACSIFKKYNMSIGKVYFVDNIGDILGGFIFSFILIYFLNSFQSAMFIFLINILILIYLTFRSKKKLFII